MMKVSKKNKKNLTLFPLGAAPLRDCCFAAAAAAPVPAGCAQSGGTAGHLDGRHLVRTTAPIKQVEIDLFSSNQLPVPQLATLMAAILSERQLLSDRQKLIYSSVNQLPVPQLATWMAATAILSERQLLSNRQKLPCLTARCNLVWQRYFLLTSVPDSGVFLIWIRIWNPDAGA